MLKRHPRLAVWLSRAGEYGPGMVCGFFAAVSFIVLRSWPQGVIWLGALGIVVNYQWRTRTVWAWAWQAGQYATLQRMIRLADPETVDYEQLREAYMAQPPTFRQEQDRLARIDQRATLLASLEELERQWSSMSHPGGPTEDHT